MTFEKVCREESGHTGTVEGAVETFGFGIRKRIPKDLFVFERIDIVIKSLSDKRRISVILRKFA